MKNILVTGGAGFIGSHTCLNLLDKGFNVFVIDSFQNSSEKVIKRILEIYKSGNNNPNINLKVFKGNLCDKKFIKLSKKSFKTRIIGKDNFKRNLQTLINHPYSYKSK